MDHSGRRVSGTSGPWSFVRPRLEPTVRREAVTIYEDSMSRRDPRITLAQIRAAAEKAGSLCAIHTLDSLLADWKATAALERCIGRKRCRPPKLGTMPDARLFRGFHTFLEVFSV